MKKCLAGILVLVCVGVVMMDHADKVDQVDLAKTWTVTYCENGTVETLQSSQITDEEFDNICEIVFDYE